MVQPDRDGLKAGSKWMKRMKPWSVDWKMRVGRQAGSKALAVVAAEANGLGVGRIRKRVIAYAPAARLRLFAD
jgi:hypothetical protein